jgi:hypothetical protein
MRYQVGLPVKLLLNARRARRESGEVAPLVPPYELNLSIED